jgi:hypothetical protein
MKSLRAGGYLADEIFCMKKRRIRERASSVICIREGKAENSVAGERDHYLAQERKIF